MGNTSSKTRYLYSDAKLESDSLKVLGEATYLHTYIESLRSTTKSLVKEILDQGRFLRVLSVPGKNISELLNSPKNHMKHLRYLKLSVSEIEEVPDSVCTLYSLQTLDLSYCWELSKLPTNIGNLTNLRHLSITRSNRIKKMPPRMGNLKELRTLTGFVVGKADDDDDGCSSIKELGELQHLAGELRVRGLQNVETVDDARKANFRHKENLVRLVLEWDVGEEAASTGSETEVLDALQPHTNLEGLSILGYPASNFPNWVGHSSFSKMVSVKLKSLSSSTSIGDHRLTSLEICDCPEIESFPDRGLPLSLESLEIENCGKLVAQNMHWDLQRLTSLTSLEIRNDYGNLDSFPQGLLPASLTSFTLWGFENLKSLNGTAFQPIKSLLSLDISNCKELESLPEQVLPNSLITLYIDNCPLLERRYRKQKGDDWRYISHIPQIIIRGETTDELNKQESENSASTNA